MHDADPGLDQGVRDVLKTGRIGIEAFNGDLAQLESFALEVGRDKVLDVLDGLVGGKSIVGLKSGVEGAVGGLTSVYAGGQVAGHSMPECHSPCRQKSAGQCMFPFSEKGSSRLTLLSGKIPASATSWRIWGSADPH